MTGYPPERHVVLQRRREGEIASVSHGGGPPGAVAPPPKRHASYATVTLQLLALHKSTATQNPCRSHGLQEEFGILDEALLCIGVES